MTEETRRVNIYDFVKEEDKDEYIRAEAAAIKPAEFKWAQIEEKFWIDKEIARLEMVKQRLEFLRMYIIMTKSGMPDELEPEQMELPLEDTGEKSVADEPSEV